MSLSPIYVLSGNLTIQTKETEIPNIRQKTTTQSLTNQIMDLDKCEVAVSVNFPYKVVLASQN